MNIFSFLLLLGSFALVLIWYIQNFERRSDGERGWLLALKPDREEDRAVNSGETIMRGAEAVKHRAEALGVAKKKVAMTERRSRAERIRSQGEEKSADNNHQD